MEAIQQVSFRSSGSSETSQATQQASLRLEGTSGVISSMACWKPWIIEISAIFLVSLHSVKGDFPASHETDDTGGYHLLLLPFNPS